VTSVNADVLPDVLQENLDVVFCGTAAGRRSAELKAYYAGAGNRFWPTLFEAGLTPVLLEPWQYARVREFGIGLTDLAKQASGADHTLRRADFSQAQLRNKLRKYRPRILAFTSKRAAREFFGHGVGYGQVAEPVEGAIAFVLTSPSGLARRYWSRGQHWRDLAKLRRSLVAQ